MLSPFLRAAPLLERIEAEGFEAYFVGGSVRDSLLDRKISDVDIATSALPEELKRIFPKTVDIGIAHGTILVIYEGVPYEITTFRSESGYTDYRRPDKVEFIRSLFEDLKRRDFTMNAIAMDRKGSLIDPYGGQEAISKKQIITVGNPAERFKEDALRLMRAIRFVSQLGFSIEKETLSALISLPSLLEKIAIERKLAEFEKILTGSYRDQALSILTTTGMIQYLPGLAGQERSLIELGGNILTTSKEEIWVLLMHHIGLDESEASKFLRQWKLPVKRIKRCLDILHWLQFRKKNNWTPRAAYHSGKDTLLAAENIFQCLGEGKSTPVAELASLFDQLPIKERSELMVTGDDLISWFNRKPGPWIKDYLIIIEESVISGAIVNRKADIKEWLFNCNRNLEKG